MPQYRGCVLMLTLLVVLATALCGCDKGGSESATGDNAVSAPESSSKDYTTQLKELYEKAKESGEQVPKDILEWAKADMKKIGTWDYNIVSFTSESDDAMLAELKKLGSQKWECFWVEPIPGGKRFYMKKPVRSYLQLTGKVSSFVPIPGVGQ